MQLAYTDPKFSLPATQRCCHLLQAHSHSSAYSPAAHVALGTGLMVACTLLPSPVPHIFLPVLWSQAIIPSAHPVSSAIVKCIIMGGGTLSPNPLSLTLLLAVSDHNMSSVVFMPLLKNASN